MLSVEQIKSVVSDYFRDKLMKKVWLFGSYARGEARETRLFVIGEYGDKGSRDLKSQFTEIEWQLMKAARNFYVHVYDSVRWPMFGNQLKKTCLPSNQELSD
jgi:uncharacterized protein with HEPN domain